MIGGRSRGTARREPGSNRRAAGWALVALGLVAIVAMEAHGAAWSQHRDGSVHSLPHGVVVVGGVVAGIVAVVIFVFMLVGTRVTETPDQRRKRWTGAITFLIVIILISIIRLAFHPSHHATTSSGQPAAGGSPVDGSGNGATHTSDTWWPLVIVGLGTSAAFVAAVMRRSITDAPTGPGDDAATIAMLDASLDDLRTEPDPRRAVVAAYARMERRLAASGFARQPWETPTEYLHRCLTIGVEGSGVEGSSVDRIGVEPVLVLTELAERARFSAVTIDEPMRARAIAALETLRRELRERSTTTTSATTTSTTPGAGGPGT